MRRLLKRSKVPVVQERPHWALKREYTDIDGTLYASFVSRGYKSKLFRTRADARKAMKDLILSQGWWYKESGSRYSVVKVVETTTELVKGEF